MSRNLVHAYSFFILTMAAAAAASIVAMSLFLSYDVMLRLLLNRATAWASPLSEYTLVFATFFAAPWVLRNHEHVSVNIFSDLFKPAARRKLRVVTMLICAIASFVMCFYSGKLVLSQYSRGLHFASIWPFPMYLAHLPIPIGSFFLGLEFLFQAFHTKIDYPEGGSKWSG